MSSGESRTWPCRWPGCHKRAKVAFWGCFAHWYKIPLELRMRRIRAFRPGFELGGPVTIDYHAAERDIQDWISDQAAGEMAKLGALVSAGRDKLISKIRKVA